MSLTVDISKRWTSSSLNLRYRFQLDAGLILGISGPSGSGKSTLLNLIAGLAKADYGTIRFGGSTWLDSKTFFPVQHRRIAYVFQQGGLFPHLNVRDNLLLVNQNESELQAIIDELGLSEFLNQNTSSLSGGQYQLSMIARSLLFKPSLLLLDEPFSALDKDKKQKAQACIVHHVSAYKTPCILVTHDERDIEAICDQSAGIINGQFELFENQLA